MPLGTRMGTHFSVPLFGIPPFLGGFQAKPKGRIEIDVGKEQKTIGAWKTSTVSHLQHPKCCLKQVLGGWLAVIWSPKNPKSGPIPSNDSMPRKPREAPHKPELMKPGRTSLPEWIGRRKSKLSACHRNSLPKNFQETELDRE